MPVRSKAQPTRFVSLIRLHAVSKLPMPFTLICTACVPPLSGKKPVWQSIFDAPGMCLIEWPEKAEGTLPTLDLQISITAGELETERQFELKALSDLGLKILTQLQGDLP
jgi:hypothetical protein